MARARAHSAWQVAALAALLLSTTLAAEPATEAQKAEGQSGDTGNEPAAAAPDREASAPTADQLREIAGLFDSLLKASKGEDGHGITRLFDLGRTMRLLSKQGAFAGSDLMEIMGVRWGLEVAMRFQPMTLFTETEWHKHTLGRVRLLDDRSEAEVFVRHGDEFEQQFWVRWWIRHDADKGWRVYDYEVLTSTRRWSANMAHTALEGRQPKGNHRTVRLLLDGAYNNLQAGELETAEELLGQLDEMEVQPVVAASRWLYAAYIAEQRSNGKAILDCLGKALAISPDIPIAAAHEARAYAELSQPEKAIAAARRSLEQLGPDAEMYELMGTALSKLERPEEAAAAFRQGLAQQPSSQTCFLGLARALPAGGKAELGPLFQRIASPRDVFDLLCGSLYFERDMEAMDVVIAAYRRQVKDDYEADYYDAMARMIEKKYDAAAEILLALLPKVTDEYELDRFREAYMDAMIEGGKSLEAYEAVPDPLAAFNYLASQLHARAATSQLRSLVAAHGKRQPDDPWLYYYQALAEVHDKQFDEAEKSLTNGVRRTLNPDILEAFRSQRVLVRHAARRAIEAYGQVSPPRPTFAQLAAIFLEEKDTKQLQKLIELHRQNDPKDPALPIWVAEDQWLRNDFSGVVDTLIAHRDDILDSQDHAFLYRYEELLLRSLLRLKRFEEAQSIAESIESRDDDAWPLVIVHTVWGNVEKAAQYIDKHIDRDAGDVQTLYSDPDVGPALHSDAFRTLREKYPELKAATPEPETEKDEVSSAEE